MIDKNLDSGRTAVLISRSFNYLETPVAGPLYHVALIEAGMTATIFKPENSMVEEVMS